MKPLRVEFQAFGPYAGREEVDFEALSKGGLFLICGKTGTGKTMILDAITFALYGKSSGNGRNDFEAMRCTGAPFEVPTYVLFEFENNGETYRFERRLEPKRKRLSASYNLMRRDDDGAWEVLLENAREKALGEKAVEIIGLEYDQFRQVIVLPQGQFERLLTSKSEEKEEILTSIFGEEKWHVIAERFYAEAEERKNALKEAKDKLKAGLADEGCETIEQLEDKLQGSVEARARIEEEHREAGLDEVIDRQKKMLTLAGRFKELRNAGAKLEELQAGRENRDRTESRIRDARRAEKVRPLMDAAHRAEENLRKRSAEEESAREALVRIQEMAARAAEELKAHRDKSGEIEERNKLAVRYETKRADYEGIEAALRDLADKQKKARTAADEERAARLKFEAGAERLIGLREELRVLQDEHDALLMGYLQGITGELAAQLEEGKPCPVCGSTEHPHKAVPSGDGATREAVDAKKDEADNKSAELSKVSQQQEELLSVLNAKQENHKNAENEVKLSENRIAGMKQNMVEGIPDLKSLDAAIEDIRDKARRHAQVMKNLEEAERKASQELASVRARIDSAVAEVRASSEKRDQAARELSEGLIANGFASEEEATAVLLAHEELERGAASVSEYDANLRTAGNALRELQEELRDHEEPDVDECNRILDEAMSAKETYVENRTRLDELISRLTVKANAIRKEGAGLEEQILRAEEDYVFAKKLRGDSGTGLRRYVLGVLFSSVVSAANRLLENIHGGRYRLYRSDEKIQGSNKRGLELKVFDRNSAEHDGRFVNTLSGGEKFLASLALSIGMSTMAQKSGIRIEALFIDEGFGSLDEDSIGDAMSVLSDIQEANGLVGIISHVQLLQDQIPNKLIVESGNDGSHVVPSLG